MFTRRHTALVRSTKAGTKQVGDLLLELLVLRGLLSCYWLFSGITIGVTHAVTMNQTHGSFHQKPHTIEWSAVSDASMRIDAIISGQAVVLAPSANQSTTCAEGLTPIPHTVVVIKHAFKANSRETRAHRAGRISRQFITIGDPEEGDNGCCSIFTGLCATPCWRRHKAPGPLVRC